MFFESQILFVRAFQSRNKKAFEVSYEINHCITMAGEVHTIAERQVNKLFTLNTAEYLLDKKSARRNYCYFPIIWKLV